jgi:hypothetical protein
MMMMKEIEDLRAQIRGALEKVTRTETRIEESGETPSPGDLYAFSETARDGIEWAVILSSQSDADLWFAVPFDQNPLVGTWDVEVSEYSDAGPGTLRCGNGIWIYADNLGRRDRSGFLESRDVEAARSRLAAMVEGGKSVVSRWHVDDDPDYQAWLVDLEHAGERLERRFRETPTLSIANFSTDWSASLGIASERPVSLAADSNGLGAGPFEPIPKLQGTVLRRELPGVLVVVHDEDGIRLLYFAYAEESPPAVRVGQPEAGEMARWRLLYANISQSIEVWTPNAPLTIEGDDFRCVVMPES